MEPRRRDPSPRQWPSNFSAHTESEDSPVLIVVSSSCLLFAACALLYQADERRSSFGRVKASSGLRLWMRAVAVVLFLLTLNMVASLRGWELGIPIWLGIFSFVFVVGLYLSAQRPDWHPKVAIGAAGLGTLAGIAAVIS